MMQLKERVEFITVSLETCSFIEQAANYEKKDFISKLLKILPLVYLKTSLLKTTEFNYEETPERFVTEYDYERIRLSVAELLGSSDDFLTIYTPDMQLSETPLYITVSELLADVYQELKDYVLCCQYNDEDVQSDALNICLTGFYEHWGQKLLSIMQALHKAYYNGDDDLDS
ncbi:MAG: DUF5063 domain-containing protein [Paludibacteraceae bacterium]|nr:DUF5063 domain-containing protein [Paludibacteraceae bacterium]